MFGEAGLGLNAGKEERKLNDKLYRKTSSTQISLGLSPGISFQVTRKLQLETELGNLFSLYYQSSKAEDYNTNTGSVSGTTKSNRFSGYASANGFNGLSVGLRWILPAKK